MNFKRNSGILMHISSLPSPYGIGTFGNAAKSFINFLSETKTKYWQVLPFGPTGYGDSPYQTFSAFACNPLFIDLDDLVSRDFLLESELPQSEQFSDNEVEYDKIHKSRNAVFTNVFNRFDLSNQNFKDFCERNKFWLDDYADFVVFKTYFDSKPWTKWNHEIKLRKEPALNELRIKLKHNINKVKVIQFLAFEQWNKVKNHAHKKGVSIIGDIPIFVSMDSSDVWANPENYKLDNEHEPITVAGVPPDYFSKTGQLWGNPIYNWEKMKENGFDWWIKRFEHIFNWVDVVRIDHFRGFSACWEVPYGEKTAINGKWKKAPGKDIFSAVDNKLGKLPIIAEDLGIITNEVVALKKQFDFPGMKILQFAFDSDEKNPYLPHNYNEPCIVYTGTHDNNTTLGWYENLDDNVKESVDFYINKKEDHSISNLLIKEAWKSTSDIAITPVQDLLCLDSKARLNTPGTLGGNWDWRLEVNQLKSDQLEHLKKINMVFDRKVKL